MDTSPPAPTTILVVEDDRALSVGLDLNLTDEGYRVLLAADGDIGLAKALDAKPDLIVLDLMLPGLDGFSLLTELRRRGRQVPVIILSARAEEYDKVKGFGVGADDYVTKPFSLAELLARISAVLRRQRQAQDAGRWVAFDDIAIDTLGRQVTRAGKPVDLTAREFDLLAHLVAHAGQSFRREQLLAAAWGFDYQGTARTVDNFVRSLRRKIEKTPDAPRHLVTVHGVGYRFEV